MTTYAETGKTLSLIDVWTHQLSRRLFKIITVIDLEKGPLISEEQVLLAVAFQETPHEVICFRVLKRAILNWSDVKREMYQRNLFCFDKALGDETLEFRLTDLGAN